MAKEKTKGKNKSEMNFPVVQETNSNEIDTFIKNSFKDSSIEDFETARKNILSMVESGTISVEKLADLAERSQSPRVYEVLYSFITSMVQANKDLLDIQKKIRELKDPNPSSNMNAKTINQTAIFCGSTTELQKVIKTMNLEKIAGSKEEFIEDGEQT